MQYLQIFPIKTEIYQSGPHFPSHFLPAQVASPSMVSYLMAALILFHKLWIRMTSLWSWWLASYMGGLSRTISIYASDLFNRLHNLHVCDVLEASFDNRRESKNACWTWKNRYTERFIFAARVLTARQSHAPRLRNEINWITLDAISRLVSRDFPSLENADMECGLKNCKADVKVYFTSWNQQLF